MGSNPPKYDRFTSGVCYAGLKITLNFSWEHQVVVQNIVCMKKKLDFAQYWNFSATISSSTTIQSPIISLSYN